ncbi:MAG TPA: ATP-binding protein [Planctomycetota bacterium]|nr:ATP-binding protein [Planctomycetota bacterium]
MPHKHLSIPPDSSQLKDVRHAVMEVAWACMPGKAHLVALAVDEAVANVILHGAGRETLKAELSLPAVSHAIDVDIDSCGEKLEVRIGDEGPAYDPNPSPGTDLAAQVRSRQRHGMGLLIMRQVMDEIHYQRLDGRRNELRLVKYIDPEPVGE